MFKINDQYLRENVNCFLAGGSIIRGLGFWMEKI